MGTVFVGAGIPLTAPPAFSGLSSGASVVSWGSGAGDSLPWACVDGVAAGPAAVACAAGVGISCAGEPVPPEREQEVTARTTARSVSAGIARRNAVCTGVLPLEPECSTEAGSVPPALPDRKSTRLNSSHGYISYAVFCLKKKKQKKKQRISCTTQADQA